MPILCWLATARPAWSDRVENPEVLRSFLNRIGSDGAANRFVTVVDDALSTNGKETFTISASNGKPCISGSSVLAVTTGINWYLNHTAHVNLAWNNLQTDLSSVSLPLPAGEETHTSTADYRYYLNYCTFSYSMAFWTQERWQQEIDWMALHGINMPLALVGLDVVWKKTLEKLGGYSEDEINDFIAGPGFQAWWAMNNLEGWGGPNKAWWYERQEQLCRFILGRMRELGMSPVLPGYSGMVPSNISSKKGWNVSDPGRWCYFQRPAFLLPTDDNFPKMAELYYESLNEVMGTSAYYSMDPFHEGGNTGGVNLSAAFKSIENEMVKANASSKWVMQSWNENPRSEALSSITKGRLIILDLFSDGQPKWQSGYNGHEIVYCMLHNFGGRVGLHGRLENTVKGYYEALAAYPSTLKGVGATPEGIETNPMLYDALFELPWQKNDDISGWLDNYSTARYGTSSTHAKAAWQELAASVYACKTSQQGTSEPVICARPALEVNSVSTWSTSQIYYDPLHVVRAAADMLAASEEISADDNANFKYDLVDITRQAVTDRANSLLKQINAAYKQTDKTEFNRLKDMYLELILDQDKLLATCPEFTLGRWTQMARQVTEEVAAPAADKEWMEWNARTLITVWGGETNANYGGLHDYSNREWSGLLKDYYYPRWEKYFECLNSNQSAPDWFKQYEEPWTRAFDTQYSAEAVGNSIGVAKEVFAKYFTEISCGDARSYLSYAKEQDIAGSFEAKAYLGKAFEVSATAKAGITSTLSVDINNNGEFDAGETVSGTSISIPETASASRVKACLSMSDGTKANFYVTLREEITDPREIRVENPTPEMGSAAIKGTTETTVNTTEDVTVEAVPNTGYDFVAWRNASGQLVSYENPYAYYGKAAAVFVPEFRVNKWGSVEENDKDLGTIQAYEQYVARIGAATGNDEPETIYAAEECPSTLFNVVQGTLQVARGAHLTLAWNDTEKRGLSYCNLSAYIDFDNDGEFELVEARGRKNNNSNSNVSEGTLRIDLPSDMPLGVTHIRLRFDSSWADGFASDGSMPAKASTQRMIYEIVANVTELPEKASKIAVVSTSPEQGTVAISGLGTNVSVQPGDRIILQAQPQGGYALDYWEDNFGNKVSNESNYSFVPVESGTYTAHFKKNDDWKVAFGNWQFKYEEGEKGIRLTEVISGEGPLSIPESYDGTPVCELGHGLFAGNTALTSISLPASLDNAGNDDTVFSSSFQGNGTQDELLPLGASLSGRSPWTLRFDARTDGSTFNTWGSCLLASGTTALADNYAGNFQFYLKADGSLSVKYNGSNEAHIFTNTQNSPTFSVEMDYDGKGGAVVTTTNASGKRETATLSAAALDDIATFTTALPAGISLPSITLQDRAIDTAPFRGCSALQAIQAAEGSAAYKSIDGVLYTASGQTLLAYPEGRTARRLFLPESTTSIAAHAFTAAPMLERIVTTAEEPAQAATDAFENATYCCQPSAAVAESYKAAWGLPILLSAAPGEEIVLPSSGTDIIEICGNGATTGTASGTAGNAARWYTADLSASRLYPIYFPSAPAAILAEQADGTLVEAEENAIRFYDYDGTAFSLNNAPGAGAHLAAVSDEWSGTTFTFRFATVETPIDAAFRGNATLQRLSVSDAYLYDVAANLFTRTGTVQDIYPFEAYLHDDGTGNAAIAGPENGTSGLNTATADGLHVSVKDGVLTVEGSSDYSLYDMRGVRIPAHQRLMPGTYLLKTTESIRKILVQ